MLVTVLRPTPVARLTLSCLVVLLPALLAGAVAQAAEPLYTKNLSPVAGLLSLPSPRAAALQPAGAWSLAAHGAIASHAVFDSGGNEALRLDGETRRFALEWRYAVSDYWELQLELPWLGHSGGSLDELIDGWHDLWGMPDGGRDEVPQDVLRYRYASAAAGFDLRDSASGLGDVTVALNRRLHRSDAWNVSAGIGYTLATGEERDFLGSGAEDTFLVLRTDWSPADSRFSWQGQAGYLRAGSSPVLGAAQERNLWFAGVGVHWAWTSNFALLAQVDSHSAPLQSGLTALGGSALLLSAGARWQLSPRWAMDVGFVEDIRVETAPDVTFQASLRFTP